MTAAQLERCRKRLEQFLVDLLAPVGRSERRHWGSVYVRGLLLDGERKSVGPMAKRLPDGNEQAMQQLILERLGEYLATVQRERKKLHEMTQSRQCFKPTQVLIGELNRHLRGWMNSSPPATPSVPTVRSCAAFGTV